MTIKLHIGGIEKKEDWKILNLSKLNIVDYIGDIGDLTMFDDGSCEAVYASHVLEHVPQAKVINTLKGINRILIPGGKFYISVPDLDILCKLFINPVISIQEKFHIMRIIYGGQIDSNDFHYFGWNLEFMAYFLKEAGFFKIERKDSLGLFNDTSECEIHGVKISLNLIASK
jgi:predicted SAM-dependent methyltransferase